MFFIFDWDGTICDSTAKIVRCMQMAAEDANLSILDDDVIKNIIGLGLPEAIVALYPEIQADDIKELRAAYANHFVREDTQPSPFFPGVMETLETLRDSGYTLAIATGKSRRGLDRVLKNVKLGSFFNATRCADETASKPNPLMLNELLAEFSVDVHDAVMVGDTEYDMAMASEIRMRKIAVSYGAHHIDRLKKHHPIMCIDNFKEMLSVSIKL
ncbi:MAG: phosphoglycolate phosphatase [Lentisphaeria bacterium]|jgi:phosphoglycolate phosphatase